MKSKKGYAYFIELILAVVIIFIIFSTSFESNQTVFEHQQNQNLRWDGWHIIKNIDEFGALDSENISKLDTYVGASLDEFTAYDLELYNDSGCYPIDNGVVGSSNYTKCPKINASTENNIVSTLYTFVQNNQPNSIRIYLWRKI